MPNRRVPSLPLEQVDGHSGGTLAVVLVNYRSARDTIECLESLLRSERPVRVIVVDNASGDGSVEMIRAWANGHTQASAAHAPLAGLSSPPVAKPIALHETGPDAALHGAPLPALTLILSDRNSGFGGGNNLGIRLALQDPEVAWCWCLNNDTVVEPGTVGALIDTLTADPGIAMCGTQIRQYFRPDHWECLNGHRFNWWKGGSLGLFFDTPVGTPFDAEKVRQATDFVHGGSLLLSRAFLEQAGLFDERFFLFFEELDLRMRMPAGLHVGFAANAVVYHKRGASIGSRLDKQERSAFADYHLSRSKLIFYRKHRPLLVPLQMALILLHALREGAAGKAARARAYWRAALHLPL